MENAAPLSSVQNSLNSPPASMPASARPQSSTNATDSRPFSAAGERPAMRSRPSANTWLRRTRTIVLSVGRGDDASKKRISSARAFDWPSGQTFSWNSRTRARNGNAKGMDASSRRLRRVAPFRSSSRAAPSSASATSQSAGLAKGRRQLRECRSWRSVAHQLP